MPYTTASEYCWSASRSCWAATEGPGCGTSHALIVRMMPNLACLLLVLGLGAADWTPVRLGPRTTALVTARLAVTCFGQVPPVAYQMTEAGVAVKVGSRRVRTSCTQ